MTGPAASRFMSPGSLYAVCSLLATCALPPPRTLPTPRALPAAPLDLPRATTAPPRAAAPARAAAPLPLFPFFFTVFTADMNFPSNDNLILLRRACVSRWHRTQGQPDARPCGARQ